MSFPYSRAFALLLFLCISLPLLSQAGSGPQQAVTFTPPGGWPSLPVVRIWTDSGKLPSCDHLSAPEGSIGNGTTNAFYETGRMLITLGKDTLFDSGKYEADVSGMRFKVRGNGSSRYRYPNYRVKLSRKADPFDFGYTHKTWLLQKVYQPDTLAAVSPLFDCLVAREVALAAGIEWQPDYRFCFLTINNSYRGLYQWAEPVQADPNRVRLAKDGFLVENDPYWWNEDGIYFDTPRKGTYFKYTYKYPEPEQVDAATEEWFSDRFTALEYLIYRTSDMSSMGDYATFAGWLLAHDVLGTTDYGGANMYYHCYDASTDTSLIRMGPLWDFDSCFRQEGWSPHHQDDVAYFPCLLRHEKFRAAYVLAFATLQNTLVPRLDAMMDDYTLRQGAALDSAIVLENKLCGTNLGTLADTREFLHQYMVDRLAWIAAHLDELDALPAPALAEAPEADALYDLAGRRLRGKPTHGVYIQGGRRVLVTNYR